MQSFLRNKVKSVSIEFRVMTVWLGTNITTHQHVSVKQHQLAVLATLDSYVGSDRKQPWSKSTVINYQTLSKFTYWTGPYWSFSWFHWYSVCSSQSIGFTYCRQVSVWISLKKKVAKVNCFPFITLAVWKSNYDLYRPRSWLIGKVQLFSNRKISSNELELNRQWFYF